MLFRPLKAIFDTSLQYFFYFLTEYIIIIVRVLLKIHKKAKVKNPFKVKNVYEKKKTKNSGKEKGRKKRN